MIDKKEIVAEFLKHGILLTPDEIERLDESNYKEILLEKLGKKIDDLEIEKKMLIKNNMSVDDVVNMNRNVYDKLVGIIVRKMKNVVSIDKSRKLQNNVEVIGRVVERNENGFVLEDLTGSIEVVGDVDVEIGDVVGVSGFVRNEKLIPDKITYPDIPLDNQHNIVDVDEIKFMNNERKIIIQDKGIGVQMVDLVKVKKQNKTMYIFSVQAGNVDKKDVEKTLKKRMFKIYDMLAPVVLEPIPDVIWLFDNKDVWKMSYKGVLVVSTKNNTFAVYKPKKNEIIFNSVQ